MADTYRSADAASRDKARIEELREALHASPSVLRRNGDGLWALQGRPGCYASTWGDGASWQLVAAPETEVSSRQWTAHKNRMAFAEVAQDGDADGCFRLHRLPTAVEAAVIRDILGVRKAVDLSPDELERRREVARRSFGRPVKTGS